MATRYRAACALVAAALIAACLLAARGYFAVSAQFRTAQTIELEATPVSSAEVKLTWRINHPGVIGGIHIYRARAVTPGDFALLTILSAKALSYIDSGLKTGSAWVYRIQTQGRKSIPLSAPSNAVRVTMAPDGPIQALIARAMNANQIELKWAMPNAAQAAALRVYRSSSLDPNVFALVASIGATLRSYLDSNLRPGVTYYYQMRYSLSGHDAHLSPPSNTASATTPNDSKPNPRVEGPGQRPASAAPFKLSPDGAGGAIPYDEREDEALYQLNEYRASRGVGPVRPSLSLSRAADLLSRQLADRGPSSARDGDGADTAVRARSSGYRHDTRFDTVMFTARVDPATMIELLKTLPEENAILLDPAWKVVGIGRSFGEQDGGWRWVFDFAAYWDQTIPLPGEDAEGRIDGNERVRTRPPSDALVAGASFTGYGDDGNPYSSRHCIAETDRCWKDPALAVNRSLRELSLPENMVGVWRAQYQISSRGATHFNDPEGFDLTEFTMTLMINEDGTWVSQGYRAGQNPTPQEAGTWKWVHDASRDEEIVTFHRDEGRPAAVIRVHAAPNVLTFFAADGGEEMQNFFLGIPADSNPADDPQVVFIPGQADFLAPAGAFPAALRCNSCPRDFTRW